MPSQSSVIPNLQNLSEDLISKRSLNNSIRPDGPQIAATIPTHDIWVAASAGSGKTTVLINRVLRLMLPHKSLDNDGIEFAAVAPHKIICITFTKAAAAQMSLRIQKKLGDWSTMSEDLLIQELENLTNSAPDQAMIQTARELFSRVLDSPGGLSIMTIHSFCQSVLARFPIEAGISPGFKVIEEWATQDYLSKAIFDLIINIKNGARCDLHHAFSRIALVTDLDRLRQTLFNLSAQQDRILKFCDQHGTGETLRQNIIELHGFKRDQTLSDIILGYVSNRPESKLTELCYALANSSKRNADIAQYIADWLALTPVKRCENLTSLSKGFFKKNGFDHWSLTKKFIEQNYTLYQFWIEEGEKLKELLQTINTFDQAAQTADFLTLAHATFLRFHDVKTHYNVLDFDDLITKTYHLLNHTGQDWVHYKLDEGIDHILLDEAQDTSPYQWEIIRKLCEEFTSGWGRETAHERSLFVVGDKKQSIYSFHGADPSVFDEMSDYFRKKSLDAGRVFEQIRLDKSYRTSSPVLKCVDEVFSSIQIANSIGIAQSHKLQHTSNRPLDAGLVEIWDLPQKIKPEKQDLDFRWSLPAASSKPEAVLPPPQSQLAVRISQHIWNMIESRELLESQGRPIEPRDILILVRTRNGPFVTDLIRQLKLLQIPVSGIDRMSLRDQIAVEDCLALARFSRFPQDDLSLACLLKSPFIRLNDEFIMQLCLARTHQQSLWEYLQLSNEISPEIITWLRNQIHLARHLSAFNFFDQALICSCPGAPDESARLAFSTHLGPDCIDPLDEFLEYCRKKQTEDMYSLEAIVTSLEKMPVTIKRDQEDPDKDSGNQIRIMTVHASKGLESPIVYLPDTVSMPITSKITPLLWVKNKGGIQFPLWSSKPGSSSPLYATARELEKTKAYDEYLRLLYVAMTRPKDRLYVCGPACNPDKKNLDQTWYGLVDSAFERLENVQRRGDIRVYSSPQIRNISKLSKFKSIQDTENMPSWLKTPPTNLQDQIYIQPSHLGRSEDFALSPLENTTAFRFERGILTHKLFQFLPDIDPAYRAEAAEKFLKKSSPNLPNAICAEIKSEVLNIMDDPVFAPVFGKHSFAEVAVAGEIAPGRILSGQIDRLVIEDNRALIVDYKTNRPSPHSSADIPQAYRNQLRAYYKAISQIYPSKTIHCAILWTDRAILMPVDISES